MSVTPDGETEHETGDKSTEEPCWPEVKAAIHRKDPQGLKRLGRETERREKQIQA